MTTKKSTTITISHEVFESLKTIARHAEVKIKTLRGRIVRNGIDACMLLNDTRLLGRLDSHFMSRSLYRGVPRVPREHAEIIYGALHNAQCEARGFTFRVSRTIGLAYGLD